MNPILFLLGKGMDNEYLSFLFKILRDFWEGTDILNLMNFTN